jgi:lysophospholipid acyltransferase (LPLAT)-like uncharacterized protein
VVPHESKPAQRLLGNLIVLAERFLTASLRCQWEDHSGLTGPHKQTPVIFCLWHNRLAISMLVHRRYPRNLAALVSASRDGALLAAFLEAFGVQPVRGSSSRRGPQALLEMVGWAERGFDLAVTPDGPRGPRYVVQPGVIALAQITGLPIIPVSSNSRSKFSFRSWDRFQIPLPFGRCRITLHEPLLVPRHAAAAESEALRARVEMILTANSED